MGAPSAKQIIARRRDGLVHSRAEIAALVAGAVSGEITDDQLGAWLMAAYLRPLTKPETEWLTEAMAASGDRLDLGSIPTPVLDKHSTGGVGDKTTLIVCPILAACGVSIAKMSGRGLGITGGTTDKLGSIPGYRLDLSPEELVAQVRRVGLGVIGQTARLAPADGVLYRIRDATCTVDSVPLIVSSILSKKRAGGAPAALIDVKCGSGAFMSDLAAATELAEWLADVGRGVGLDVHAEVTDMSEPLGSCVGNALEVREAASVLRGERRGRLLDLCIHLAVAGLELATRVMDEPHVKDWARRVQANLGMAVMGRPDAKDAREMVQTALASGAALRKAKEWVEAQGGDARALDPNSPCLPRAETVWTETHRGEAGWVERWDARTVGEAVVGLGGGRKHKSDTIRLEVGVESCIEVGSWLEPGDPLFHVHAASESDAKRAAQQLLTGIRIASSPIEPRPWLLSSGRV